MVMVMIPGRFNVLQTAHTRKEFEYHSIVQTILREIPIFKRSLSTFRRNWSFDLLQLKSFNIRMIILELIKFVIDILKSVVYILSV